MTAIIDIAGQKYARLTTLNRLPNGKWLCQCECGGYTEARAGDLRSGGRRACGCRGKGRTRNPDREIVALRRILGNYRRSAAKKGISWAIDETTFVGMVKSDCYYCGAPPRLTAHSRSASAAFNGIDRLDNDQGYIEVNCVPCCYLCNYAKHTLSADTFLDLAERVYRKWFKEGG